LIKEYGNYPLVQCEEWDEPREKFRDFPYFACQRTLMRMLRGRKKHGNVPHVAKF
jgi:hypothetical protein